MSKVLIVDDEPAILSGLEHIINWAEHGCEIVAKASNGLDALEIMKAQKVDILITDVRMPKLDGLQLIKQINKNNLNIKIIILSGYDDFKYVREAIRLGIDNYLLKPINIEELSLSLLNAMEKIQSELYKQISLRESMSVFRENILYRWVTYNISNEELEEKSSIAGITLKSSNYLVAVIAILSNESLSPNLDKLENSLHSFAVRNICSEIASQSISNISFCDLNSNVVILFDEDKITSKRSKINTILNTMIENVSKLLKLNIFITIGSEESGYESVYKSYSTAMSLLEYALIFPANTIVDYEEVQKSSMLRQRKLNIDFETFNNLLIGKREAECIEFLDELFIKVRGTKGVTPSLIQSISIEMLYNIVSSIKILNNTDENISEFENLFLDIIKITKIDKLTSLLKLVIKKSINHINTEDKKLNPIIKQVLSYIDNNYNKDISIKVLSSTFNVNAAYLGQLFKNETGDMLTNYLNKIRIDKAKDMLLHSNFKANEISEKVGYVNENYFYRIFKKITGVSPTNFKSDHIT